MVDPVSRNGKMLIFSINRHRAWQVVRECAERAGLPELVNPEVGKRYGVSLIDPSSNQEENK